MGEVLRGLLSSGKDGLAERMLASIQASRELTAELRKTQADLKASLACMEKLTVALCKWTEKAEEIKRLALAK